MRHKVLCRLLRVGLSWTLLPWPDSRDLYKLLLPEFGESSFQALV
jgi:hypothetical protein